MLERGEGGALLQPEEPPGAALVSSAADDCCVTAQSYHANSSAFHAQGVLTLEVGEILHVEPPSTFPWVVASIGLTCIAAILFSIEVLSVNWGAIVSEYKRPTTVKKDKTEPHPKRWSILALMILVVVGSDVYQRMPYMIFSGEAQKLGVPIAYSGVYLGIGSLAAVFVAPFVGALIGVMSANQIQRVAISLLALVSIPQGIANQLNAAGFVALTAPLRLFEGVVMGVSETAIFSTVYSIFPHDEVSMGVGVLASVRPLASAASPVLGAALYTGSGMAAPFVVLGSVNIITVLLVRMFMLPLKPQGKGASVFGLLGIWRLNLTWISATVMMSINPAVSALAQPWLGVAPYALTPDDLAALLLMMIGTAVIAVAVSGVVLIRLIGPVATMLIGYVPLLVGLACVGTPPLLLPWIEPNMRQAIVSFVLMGIGAGLMIPAYAACFVLCIVDAGYTKESTAASLGALLAEVAFISNAFAPMIVTTVISAAGIATSAAVFFGAGLVGLTLALISLSKFLGVTEPRSPEDASDEDATPSDPGKAAESGGLARAPGGADSALVQS